MYKYLSNFFLTRRYMARLTRIQEMLYPGGRKRLEKRCIWLFFTSVAITLLIMTVGLLLGKPTVYTVIILFSLCFIFQKEWVGTQLFREENRLFHQFVKYLEDVRHFYHADGMVEEALYDSIEEAPYEIGLHMGKIHDLLLLDDEEEVERYKDTAPNKYFVTFLALCFVTIRYGDTVADGKSLFLKNLSHLKEELRIEILKREKIQYTFSGLVFLAAAPVFFLKVIEAWGIGNLPELVVYYQGGYGIVATVFIFLFTIGVYLLITRLKEEPMPMTVRHEALDWLLEHPVIERFLWGYCNRNGGYVHRIHRRLKRAGSDMSVNQYLLQKGLIFLGSTAMLFLVILHMSWNERSRALHYTNDFIGASFTSDEKEIQRCRELIEGYVNRYQKEQDTASLQAQAMEALLLEESVTGSYMAEILTEEIVQRVMKFQKLGIPWIWFFGAILLSWFLSAIPRLLFEIRGYFAKRELESEVEQFQTILLMLTPIERMNIETILSWMEVFSFYFRSSLEECVDYFPFDNEEALARLKEKEPFPEFVRIIENLEMSDRVGLMEAFDELAAGQQYLEEKRKQDNEISISNKGAVAKIAAYVPLTMTLGLYLIVPFILESMNQLRGYLQQLQ